MKNLLFLLASKSIQFESFVKLKYELDRKFKIYDGEVDEILSKLKASNKFIQVLPILFRTSALLRAPFCSYPWINSTTPK